MSVIKSVIMWLNCNLCKVNPETTLAGLREVAACSGRDRHLIAYLSSALLCLLIFAGHCIKRYPC